MYDRALVGRFRRSGTGGLFEARNVNSHGAPAWLLPKLRRIWMDTFGCNTQDLCAALLMRDWSLLDRDADLRQPPAGAGPGWIYVVGVGRTYEASSENEPQPHIATTAQRPTGEAQWAYLWQADGNALHVYAVVADRWLHLATFPAGGFAVLTRVQALDVHDRRDALLRTVQVPDATASRPADAGAEGRTS